MDVEFLDEPPESGGAPSEDPVTSSLRRARPLTYLGGEYLGRARYGAAVAVLAAASSLAVAGATTPSTTPGTGHVLPTATQVTSVQDAYAPSQALPCNVHHVANRARLATARGATTVPVRAVQAAARSGRGHHAQYWGSRG